jgi:hypothetical protein
MTWKNKAKTLSALPIVVALGACDILTVTDPSRYVEADLDDALEAVANSVEGSAHDYSDWYVIWQALLSDVYMSTGYRTTTFGLIDEGQIGYGTYPTAGVNYLYTAYNFPDKMAQHRWFARESWNRLDRVLKAELMTDPKSVQVLIGDALLDMYLGLFSCEGVLEKSPSGMFADIQIYHKAAETFDRVADLVQNVDPELLEGKPDYLNAARTGRALMLMLSEDYEGAAAEAATVPDGFSYEAVHNSSVFLQNNYVYTLTTRGRSRNAGLMEWLWPRIDQTYGAHSYIKDRWTGEHDMRMPVWYSGQLGQNYQSPHYSQWKYTDTGANIPILHSDHARLIEAEAKVMSNDYAGAAAILNNLRSRVGLAPVTPSDEEMMMEFLLEERFAELFMEGHRAVDLYRFRLTREIFEEFDDPLRRGIGRARKFPGSKREAQLNPAIDDNRSIRCEPVG